MHPAWSLLVIFNSYTVILLYITQKGHVNYMILARFEMLRMCWMYGNPNIQGSGSVPLQSVVCLREYVYTYLQ